MTISSPAVVSAIKSAVTRFSAEISKAAAHQMTIISVHMVAHPDNTGPSTSDCNFKISSPGVPAEQGSFTLHSSVIPEPSTNSATGPFQTLLQFWTNRAGNASSTGEVDSLSSATVLNGRGNAPAVAGPATTVLSPITPPDSPSSTAPKFVYTRNATTALGDKSTGAKHPLPGSRQPSKTGDDTGPKVRDLISKFSNPSSRPSAGGDEIDAGLRASAGGDEPDACPSPSEGCDQIDACPVRRPLLPPPDEPPDEPPEEPQSRVSKSSSARGPEKKRFGDYFKKKCKLVNK